MAGSGTAHLRPQDQTILRIEDLVVEFPVGRTGLKVHAVSKVSIDVLPGETLGLVGESGCGKSTMGKAVMQIVSAQSGSVLFEGKELTSLKGELLRSLRPKLQMIFQDPISSLNPRRRVRDIVREGLDIWKIGDKASRAKRVEEVLDTVGIDPSVAGPKRPHEFSGGQCQRISIARAVATEPKLIICDEPVSALDVSVQAQILNLLEDMKRKYGLTLIFIAHDLAVVKNVSDRVAVMYLGKLCEFAQPDELYAAPSHPYTAALLSAIPEPDPESAINASGGVKGEIPSPLSPPSGCRFRTRCPQAEDRCASEEPLMREVRPEHFVACHFPLGDVSMATPAAAAASNGIPSAAVVAAPVVADAQARVDPAPVAPAEPAPAAPPVQAAAVAPLPVVIPPPPPGPPVGAVPPAPAVVIPPPPPGPPVMPATAVAAAAAPVQDQGWVAPSPISPDAPDVTEPTAPEPPAPVDWTPEPTPVPVVPVPAVAVPSPPPDPSPASAPTPVVPTPAPAAEAPPESEPAAAPEPEAIPDVASLDTLLPGRSRGGSVNPGR